MMIMTGASRPFALTACGSRSSRDSTRRCLAVVPFPIAAAGVDAIFAMSTFFEDGLDAEVEKVTDVAAIAGYGVMKTPGLVVDENLLVSGRVPSADEVTELLAEATAGRQ